MSRIAIVAVGFVMALWAGSTSAQQRTDYVALANQHLGPRPAPEDNAFVGLLLSQPIDWGQAIYAARMVEALGLDTSRIIHVTYEPFFQHIRHINPQDRQSIAHQEAIALQGPWTAAQLPQLSTWLYGQDGALEFVAAAMDRPVYYAPLVIADDQRPWLNEALLPHLGWNRTIARTWQIRAYRDVANNDLSEAYRDAQLIRKLSNHMSREPTLLGRQVGVSIRSQFLAVLQTVRDGAVSDAGFLKQMADDLDALPPIDLAEAIDHCERLKALELVECAGLDEFVPREVGLIISPSFTPSVGALIEWARSDLFDPALAVQRINADVDRVLEQLARYDPHTVAELLDADAGNIRDHMRQLSRHGKPASDEMLQTAAYTQAVADGMALTQLHSVAGFLRSVSRVETHRQTQRAATAVARYRLQHGRLPPALDELVPEFLDAVPLNPRTGKALVYICSEDGTAAYIQADGGAEKDHKDNFADISAEVHW